MENIESKIQMERDYLSTFSLIKEGVIVWLLLEFYQDNGFARIVVE